MEIISTVGVEGGQGMRSQQVGYFQVHTLPASADLHIHVHGNPDTGLGRRRRRVMLPKNSPGIERHARRRPVHAVEKILPKTVECWPSCVLPDALRETEPHILLRTYSDHLLFLHETLGHGPRPDSKLRPFVARTPAYHPPATNSLLYLLWGLVPST